jgi:hypothetical protein
MATRTINGNTYSEFAIVAAEPIPVDIGGATVDISGAVTIGNVTIDNSNAAPVPVSDAGGSITVDDGGASVTVDGDFLTNVQLRATPVPVNVASSALPAGGATASLQDTGNASLGAINGKLPGLSSGRVPVDASGTTVPVSGPLTNAQLRASEVPVSGPATDDQLRASPLPVAGPLTDAQLRAAAVAVVASAPARTPTTTSIAGNASSVLILAPNANRRGLSVSNVSTSKLYLSFSTPATIANSFLEMQPGSFILFDQQLIVSNAIYGIWNNANGAAQVTEYV